MEWHLPANKPADYQSQEPPPMVFCDSAGYHTGTLRGDGKWYDRESGEAFDAIDAWAFLPDEPIALASAVAGQEWNEGNGPVKPSYNHFLLADTATGEITYKGISSSYFDSKNKTFPEISHWITLPNLPFRLAGRATILKNKNIFLEYLKKQETLETLVLDQFNDECLELAIDEIFNTTENGVRCSYILTKEDLIKETLSRWAFRVNNALNKARGKDYAAHPFRVATLPASEAEQAKIEATLDLVNQALS